MRIVFGSGNEEGSCGCWSRVVEWLVRRIEEGMVWRGYGTCQMYLCLRLWMGESTVLRPVNIY